MGWYESVEGKVNVYHLYNVDKVFPQSVKELANNPRYSTSDPLDSLHLYCCFIVIKNKSQNAGGTHRSNPTWKSILDKILNNIPGSQQSTQFLNSYLRGKASNIVYMFKYLD